MLTPYLIGMWKIEDLSSDIQFWYSDDVDLMPRIGSMSEEWPLFLGGFLTWYYMFILVTCFFFIALERTCASYFIRNYEQTSRRYIFIFLLIFQHGMVWVMHWFCFWNRIYFFLAFLYCFCLNGSAVMLFWANRRYNINLIQKFERNTKQSIEEYTLPARFQAKENVKAFYLLLRIIIVGFFLIFSAMSCLAFLNYKWLPSCGTLFLFCFENFVHLNPLIVCPTLILSVSPWSRALSLSRIPLLRKVSSISSISLRPRSLAGQNISQEQETDFYFVQLTTAWEREL